MVSFSSSVISKMVLSFLLPTASYHQERYSDYHRQVPQEICAKSSSAAGSSSFNKSGL